MLQLAGRLKEEQSLLVFGRGYNYATALEAALKVGWRCWRCCCGARAVGPAGTAVCQGFRGWVW
jgi:hypothetical protein